MINVWFDWNCIIGLEIERDYSPALRQIREWYRQGKLVLCISSTIRMEKHQSRDKRFYGEDENGLYEKLRKVGLERIEIRSPTSRFFNPPGLQPIIIREIHDRVIPSVAFSLNDHAQKPRSMGRKWNNQKNDALSIYTFATWSEGDDIFVSADEDDIIEKREMLYAPYRVLVARPDKDMILQKAFEEIPGHDIIRGRILRPHEAEKYLREKFEDQSENKEQDS